MKKQIYAFCICLAFLGLLPSASFAAPIINEFSSADSSDWIEIYNAGGEEADLSNYRIRDLTANNKLDLSGTLAPGAFASFDWSNKLNNGGDVIKFILISDESVIDQISYGDQGGITAPVSGQSIGRKTDGGPEWVLFVTGSKGSSNNSISTFSPPSPTPTKTPTPTKIPTPTKTPSPTKSPTAVKTTPTAISKTPTPKIVLSANTSTVGKTTSTKPVSSVKISDNSKSASQYAKIKPITKGSKEEIKVLGTKDTDYPPVLFLSGLAFLLAAGLVAARKILREKGIL